MQVTEAHKLEWIQISMKRWELQHKSAGGAPVAAIVLYGANWMPKVISGGEEKGVGLTQPFDQAKKASEEATFKERGWGGPMTIEELLARLCKAQYQVEISHDCDEGLWFVGARTPEEAGDDFAGRWEESANLLEALQLVANGVLGEKSL
jgi:hypothetical protein